MKNCKTFCKGQTVSFLKEIIQLYNTCPKQYFQKKNSKYEILNDLHFDSNFVFGGNWFRGVLGSAFLKIFLSSANHCGRHYHSASQQ